MHIAIQPIFSALLIVQFVVVALHDWVNIPGWAHGKQIQLVVGRRKFLFSTLANSIFPGLAVAFVFLYRSSPKPVFVTNYWLIYCSVTVISALVMWYVPYFFGLDEKTRREYDLMYTGTKQVLPRRGGNPRPNLLHIYFHVLFVTTFCLAWLLRIR